jgi:hypothetical protein
MLGAAWGSKRRARTAVSSWWLLTWPETVCVEAADRQALRALAQVQAQAAAGVPAGAGDGVGAYHRAAVHLPELFRVQTGQQFLERGAYQVFLWRCTRARICRPLPGTAPRPRPPCGSACPGRLAASAAAQGLRRAGPATPATGPAWRPSGGGRGRSAAAAAFAPCAAAFRAVRA